MEKPVASACWSCFLSVFFSFLFFCFWSLFCIELGWLELLQGWGSLGRANPETDVASSATLRIRLRFIVQHSFNFDQDVCVRVEEAKHAQPTMCCSLAICLPSSGVLNRAVEVFIPNCVERRK